MTFRCDSIGNEVWGGDGLVPGRVSNPYASGVQSSRVSAQQPPFFMHAKSFDAGQ